MLPVVIIGADDSVREPLKSWDVDLIEYPSLEEAVTGLNDLAMRGEEQVPHPIEQDDDGRWRCTVVYGPLAFGPAVTGQPAVLPHTGWTVVTCPGANQTQTVPRRVQGDRAVNEPLTLVWEAAARLRAHLVVDALDVAAMRVVCERLATTETP
jgi:hypothetical protein